VTHAASLQRRGSRRAYARRGEAGFTIVELILTTGILAIALVGVVQLFIYCLWETETAGNVTTAMSECYAKLEELRDLEFDDIVPTYGPGGTAGDLFALKGLDGIGVIQLDDSVPEILTVKVAVAWRERGVLVFGEDANLNGFLDAGEDENGSGALDSPASVVSMVSKR
jgi:hypothetical protein